MNRPIQPCPTHWIHWGMATLCHPEHLLVIPSSSGCGTGTVTTGTLAIMTPSRQTSEMTRQIILRPPQTDCLGEADIGWALTTASTRSEERRVGKECRSRRSTKNNKKNSIHMTDSNNVSNLIRWCCTRY